MIADLIAAHGEARATEVAKRLGKSQSFSAQLLEFQAAPAEVHAMVKDGKVSSTFAAETMRERPQDGKEILKAAIAKAQAEGKSKATKKHSELHTPKAAPSDAHSAPAASRRITSSSARRTRSRSESARRSHWAAASPSRASASSRRS